jgi:hypothetical protein
LNRGMQNRSKSPLESLRRRVQALVEDDPILRDSVLLDVAIVGELEAHGPGGARPERASARLQELHENYVVLPGSDPLGPVDLLVSTALARAIVPTVEDLRVAGFDSPDPPFSTVSEAVAWIERRASEARSEARRRSEERMRAIGEIERLARENGFEVRVSPPTHLPYQTPDSDHVQHAPVIPESFAHRLAHEVRRLSDRTGFPADALTMHVLAGLIPVRLRVRTTTKNNVFDSPNGQVAAGEVTIRVLTPDLSRREWDRLYSLYEKTVRKETPGRIGAADAEIWERVRDLGEPPTKHREKGPFWQRVLDAYNAAHPDAPRTSTNWVKKRYGIAAEALTPVDTTLTPPGAQSHATRGKAQ